MARNCNSRPRRRDGAVATAGGRLPLRCQEILARWPEGEPPPRADSLWRCLARGCGLGIFVLSGARNKAEAFRYGVAESAPAA